MNGRDVPLGLLYSLAQNEKAMDIYSSLSEQEKQKVIDQTHKIHSKSQMMNYVNNIGQNNFNQYR